MFADQRRARVWLAVFLVVAVAGLTAHPSLSAVSVFPTGTTVYNAQRVASGFPYVFYTITAKDQNGVVAVDLTGKILHKWLPRAPGKMLTYAEPLEGGHILALEQDLQCAKYSLLEMDWSGSVVWEYQSTAVIHHDFERLKNGNTLILCYEWANVPAISPIQVRNDFLIEVNSSGQVVWSWYTDDHFEEFGFTPEAKELIAAAGKDWAHTNSVQELPGNDLGDPRLAAGNILVSQRSTNIIFAIEKASGRIVYKIAPPDHLSIGQHDVRMIERGLPGAGDIILFDNGGYGGYPTDVRLTSRVIQFDPISMHLCWQYDAAASGVAAHYFFSGFLGSVQRFPNGNTVIDEGRSGRFFEVTPRGEIVWEYIYPHVNVRETGLKDREVYRVFRIPSGWGGLP